MKITADEVMHVANLANLELSPQEVADMTGQLDSIINYVAKLNELDTAGVQPTTHATASQNAFRDDEVTPSLTQDEALANGPLHNGEAFVVQRVI